MVTKLAERLARVEGREERELRFVSKDVLMAPVHEVLMAFRREALKPEPTGPDYQEAPVLIVGELGVGQEMIAHMIHEGSRRSTGPWINVALGAVTPEEQETELFSEKSGACALAAGGTLFFGEISKLTAANQRRFFEGLKSHHWNFRLLASVTKDVFPQLVPEIREYFTAVTLKIPALRERTEDVMPMAMHFGQRAFSSFGKQFVGFTTEAERILRIYSWPGNVRELWCLMERLA
ncbi:sigma 54-interacting transcriptional regulator, partial [Bdellovibrionota bacterium FG-2]